MAVLAVKDDFDMLSFFGAYTARMNIISLCKFSQLLPLVVVTWLSSPQHGAFTSSTSTFSRSSTALQLHRWSFPSSQFAHLRDILLSKTNDFHLIYFRCLFLDCKWLAKGFSWINYRLNCNISVGGKLLGKCQCGCGPDKCWTRKFGAAKWAIWRTEFIVILCSVSSRKNNDAG